MEGTSLVGRLEELLNTLEPGGWIVVERDSDITGGMVVSFIQEGWINTVRFTPEMIQMSADIGDLALMDAARRVKEQI